ncbi:CerR family C-terminal domain-containing protein [Streptomyces kunmingensis]|uniref:CerR family C-terminal domain-containing protein n=1 Tax=Streptomyces kunmingensis TaxID=68225 RepID=A0ABU6CH79_9ACTN|nr:TetR family transcriptional regulator [Streptomyces kunmingensis]MEB3964076.1 CerR family C-terminal domain-containing protein [Streptomyces kunmingensis]
MAASAQTPEAGLGLRERKKLKTRMTIREATYRLIMDQGYDATTVEQIAEAAEVSPSTVFRYFPTKEDIVLTDEFDPILERELRARPTDESIIDSLRHVIDRSLDLALGSDDPEVSRLRTRLQVEVPAVRSRMMESMSVTGQMVCRVLAERTGRQADDLEVRVYAMSVVGALMEATMYWAEHDHEGDLRELAVRALDTLRGGL